VILVSISDVKGANLIGNPDFDASDLAFWNTFDTIQWHNAENETGVAGSGAMLLVNNRGPLKTANAYSCINVVPGASYWMSGWTKAGSGISDGRATAAMSGDSYSMANCGGGSPLSEVAVTTPLSDVWFQLTAAPIVIPPTAVSIMISVVIYTGPQDASFSAWFDGLHFDDEFIFVDGFGDQ